LSVLHTNGKYFIRKVNPSFPQIRLCLIIGGGEYLLERSWQGLEQKFGETPVSDAIEGRLGIAAGYEGEGLNT